MRHTTPAFRFAPSPNGYLHVGHARSALIGFELAQAIGGRFLLRIEDIDGARTRTEFVDAIFEDLAWLGISWETPVLRQSEHLDDYCAAAERLRSMGVLYPCFATRSEIATVAAQHPGAVDPDGAALYPGLHRGLPEDEVSSRMARGEPYALRLDMPAALAMAERRLGGRALDFIEIGADGTRTTVRAHPERWGDVVIVRKDLPASYHLAVVVDDARQDISHVTRGRDLYAATDIHRLLQVLLGLPSPVYHHHALVVGADGQKLSKSAGSTSIRALRQSGATAADILKLARGARTGSMMR